MRKLIIGLALLTAARVATACDAPMNGPYAEPGGQAVDTIATGLALFPTLGALSACNAVMLAADIYWKVRRPQDDFGAHAGAPVCVATAQAVAYSAYVVGGFPAYAARKIGASMRSNVERIF